MADDADWSALGGNPAPGSVAELRTLSDDWRRQSAVFDGAGARMTLIGSQDLPRAWRDSPGSDALARTLHTRVGPLEDAGRLLTRGAAVVEQYTTSLAGLQAQAEQLRVQAQTAAAQLPEALAAIERFRLVPGAPRPIVLPARAQDWDELARQATQRANLLQDNLSSLTAQAGRLRVEAQAVASTAAGRLRALNGELDALPAPTGPGQGGGFLSLIGSEAYGRAQDSLVAAGPPPFPADPTAVTGYWAGLDPKLRAKYLQAYPAIVGNTDGIPAQDRDRANRLQVAADVKALRAKATAAALPLPPEDVDPATAKKQVAATLAFLGLRDGKADAATASLVVAYQVSHGVHPNQGRPMPPVLLLSYQPGAFDGRGRASISIGDPTTAAHVTVLQPGMTSTVPGYLGNQMLNANNLYNSLDQAAPGSSAVIAAISYRAPDMNWEVTDQRPATAGAADVIADLNAFSAMRNDPAHSTFGVVAHSYGSTTTATAFTTGKVEADYLVLIGSPGAGKAHTVGDIKGVPAGRVYVGAASGDPITTDVQQLQSDNADESDTALDLGTDPAGEMFGANRFRAETDNIIAFNVANHSKYYAQGSESLENITAIALGRYSDVIAAPLRPNIDDTGQVSKHFAGIDPEVTRLR